MAIWDAAECFLGDETFSDLYTFAATSRQSITLTMSSGAFRPRIRLFSPAPAFVAKAEASDGNVALQRALKLSGEWRGSIISMDDCDTGT